MDTPQMSVVTCLRYGPDFLDEQCPAQEADLSALLEQPGVIWMHVQGEPEQGLLECLEGALGVHPLALEDVLNRPQRPKAEEYDDHDFVVVHAARPDGATGPRYPQLSLCLGSNYVVTFLDGEEDLTEPVRARIRSARGQIRQLGVDYLMYALLDVMVDSYFPVLEDFGELVEMLEERAMVAADTSLQKQAHRLRRRIIDLRRHIWPQREVFSALMRDDNDNITPGVRHYLRDCYDHVVQLIDMTETYREASGDLRDLYMTAISNRMNAIMKVLTVIATIFMPLTFIVGLYGMNFSTKISPWNMPELNWRYGYLFSWGLMLVVVVVLLLFFRHMGWIGGAEVPEGEEEE